ncbi:YoaK family protein [Nocardioides sp. BP30]|uniref:YoaK family protein n=1 Tax=Nocardioides sp. BP30 TaxID=3036374 RepID=UPI00246959B9|nr:YoaK family protein [Nocardioides sp. BP30]WGL53449.1 YoaK family protein [Nocardioides sp. BP30]
MSIRQRLVAVPGERMHLWLMLVLTFTTGINDAVGYLGLDKVFTGNMTGNVVVLGMAVVGGSGLPILGPALALIGFMAGAAIAGRLLRHGSRSWHGLTTAVFAAVAVLMLVLGGVLLLVGDDPSHPAGVTVTTTAAFAMGLQAAAARLIAVKDVTTVVVTSTITGLAADLGSGRSAGAARRASAVVAIIAGAATGAALLKWHLGAGLILAGVVIALATWAGDLHDRGRARELRA